MDLQILGTGGLRKMRTEHSEKVQYHLPIGDDSIALNPLLGRHIRLTYAGAINCINCGRFSKKSFQQGHCFPCMRDLPECDTCMVRPETCHFAAGTCRDPAWGEKNCMQTHYVYLANSSGLKVGITRGPQVPTRWMDQGAAAALPIFQTQTRYEVGQVEVALKEFANDKTHWQKMLKGEPEFIDLAAERDRIFTLSEDALADLDENVGYEPIENGQIYEFNYPVNEYPEKVKSFNFDKSAVIEGRLNGIKGQYLLLDTGVINIRKFAGYTVTLEADA